jgi:ribulose-phosphate 3-epimerase
MLHVDFMAQDFAARSPIAHDELWECVDLFPGVSEVHLQSHDLKGMVERALASRATGVTVPIEIPRSLGHREQVTAAGKRMGLAISPSTRLELLVPHLEWVDSVTVMTSEPGTSDFEPEMLDRITRIRSLLATRGRASVPVVADGGMTAQRVAAVVAAGATTCVCASAVYKAPQGVAHAFANLLAESAPSNS